MDAIKLKLPYLRSTPGTHVYEVAEPTKVTIYVPKALIKGRKADAIAVTIEDASGAAAGAAAEEPEM